MITFDSAINYQKVRVLASVWLPLGNRIRQDDYLVLYANPGMRYLELNARDHHTYWSANSKQVIREEMSGTQHIGA